MIEITDLHKSFGERAILRGINLSCPEGSTTVILGGSGAGKSVLMKHVVGLMRPETGSVEVDGVRVDRCDQQELAALRTRMGMVFQQSALFDSMTVFENVAFPIVEAAREVIEEDALRRRVHQALELFDLRNVDLTTARNVLPELVLQVIDECAQRFFMLRGEVGLIEHVRCIFIRMALLNVSLHTKLVEGAFDKRNLRAHPHQRDVPRRR